MSGLTAKLALAAVLVAVPGIAIAHVGAGHGNGFAYGIAHPLNGLDHMLAMLAVGLIATQLGGRALWLVPLSFVTLMVFGAASAMAGFVASHVNVMIALSVTVLGIAVALRLRIPTLAAAALVGFFALFHGHAHGAEMPHAASGLAYGAGFIAATALLHGVGVGLGLSMSRLADLPARALERCAGGAMALGGFAILSGLI